MSESINPNHYKKSIETYDAITSQLSPIDACIMDIGKADWYLNKLIKYLNDLKNDKSFIDRPNNVAELFKDK